MYPSWLVQFIKDYSKQYVWLLRYHLPVDDMQRMFVNEFANISNIYVEGMESVLLEILLNECDIHITMSSSVIVDAAMMNKPSIILNKNFIGTFDEYLSNGICSFADNVYKLEDAIKKGLQKSEHSLNLRYAEKNRENIEFIKSLME